MGYIISLLGFICLHFHFLNLKIYNIEMFPLPISLSIMILGFLYSYKEFKDKHYLYFVFVSVFLIGITLMESYVRAIYLIVQTLLFTYYILWCFKKILSFQIKNYTHVIVGVYCFAGLLKAVCYIEELRYIFLRFERNVNIIIIISFLCLIIQAFHYRKFFIAENHVHHQVHKKPISYYFLIIFIAMMCLIVTYNPLTRYIDQKSIDTEIIEFENDFVSIKYYVHMTYNKTQYIETSRNHEPKVILKKNIKPQQLKIKNGGPNAIFEGYFDYKDNQYDFIMTQSFDEEEVISAYSYWYTLQLDNNKYPIQQKKVNYKTFSYHDKDIYISQGIILDNQVLVMPRVEFLHQKDVHIKKREIKDAQNQILSSSTSLNCSYCDGRTIYHEIPVQTSLQGKGPYTFIITFEDNTTKEYLLYENNK